MADEEVLAIAPLKPESQSSNQAVPVSEADASVFVTGICLDAVNHHASSRAKPKKFGAANRAPVDR